MKDKLMREFDKMKLVGGVIIGMICDAVLRDRKKPEAGPGPEKKTEEDSKVDVSGSGGVWKVLHNGIRLSGPAVVFLHKLAAANDGISKFELVTRLRFNSETGLVSIFPLGVTGPDGIRYADIKINAGRGDFKIYKRVYNGKNGADLELEEARVIVVEPVDYKTA